MSTPTNGKYLLDTNILIALFRHDPAAEARLAEAEEIYVPVIAIGELYFGAARPRKVLENKARLDQFVLERQILDCDVSVAREYGRLKEMLRAKGRPLPENDIWIAAIAVRYGLTLATRDEHFAEIDLPVESWSG